MALDGLQPNDLRTIERSDAMSSAAARSGARLSPRARWRLALELLLVGAVIGAIAIYTPWAVGYVRPDFSQTGQFAIRICPEFAFKRFP